MRELGWHRHGGPVTSPLPATQHPSHECKPPAALPLSTLIFASRWLQLPLYLGLIVAQCVYVFLFGKDCGT